MDDVIKMTNISGIMNDENIQSIVNVDPSLKYMYTSSENRDKDFLGCSFLLGLAFLRLCLLKCPKSIKLVGGKSSNN